MKKRFIYASIFLLAGLIAGFWSSEPVRRAWAGVACSVPFTFVNGTVADATQVNSNFSALVTCLSNAAAAGVNSDITVLAGLTTPLSVSEGGSSTFTGTANSTGSANAQVIAGTNPIGFTLTLGRKIRFIAGFQNTGAMTITVAGLGPTNLFRPTPSGPGAMVGGELAPGLLIEAVYDGTQFQMTSQPALDGPPGAVFDYAAAGGCPVGSLEANAGTALTASFPALSAALGLTWGNPGGGNFSLPDLRGRAGFGRDSGGSGRITVAGGNFDGTGVGNTGGAQNHTLLQAELPAVAPIFTGNAQSPSISAQVWTVAGGGVTFTTPGAQSALQATPTVTFTPTGTISNLGSGSLHTILSNAAIVVKCVKA